MFIFLCLIEKYTQIDIALWYIKQRVSIQEIFLSFISYPLFELKRQFQTSINIRNTRWIEKKD